jgi:hypothetical protein
VEESLSWLGFLGLEGFESQQQVQAAVAQEEGRAGTSMRKKLRRKPKYWSEIDGEPVSVEPPLMAAVAQPPEPVVIPMLETTLKADEQLAVTQELSELFNRIQQKEDEDLLHILAYA